MGKLAGEGRFSKKQFVEAPAMFFVTERVRAHELDGDLAQREGIIRQVNHTGRSFAELLDDFVFADFFHKQTAGTVIAIRRPFIMMGNGYSAARFNNSLSAAATSPASRIFSAG